LAIIKPTVTRNDNDNDSGNLILGYENIISINFTMVGDVKGNEDVN